MAKNFGRHGMISSIDILILIREYIYDPADFFRLRSTASVMTQVPGRFTFSVSNLARYLANRCQPIHERECKKLEVVQATSEVILTRTQVEGVIAGIANGSGRTLVIKLLDLKAVEPFLMYDCSMKLDRPDIGLICARYFPLSDTLRVWRRLRAAVTRGYIDIVRSLVMMGVSIGTVEADSDPLIHLAVKCNHTLIVEYLLSFNIDLSETDSDGLTAFLLACKGHHRESIKRLLSKDPNLIRQRDNDGLSCIHLALLGAHSSADPPVIEYLIDAGAEYSTIVMPNGLLLMQYACAINRLDIVKMLVSKGVSLSQTDASGRSCLDVCNMSYPIVSYLISQGVALNPRIDYLGRAAAANDPDSCRLFIAKGVTVKEPETLLAAVSTTNENSACVDLIIHLKANVNSETSAGESPLYRSVVYRNRTACESLLSAGADPNTEFKGLRLLSIAEREGYLDIAEILVNYGASSVSRTILNSS